MEIREHAHVGGVIGIMKTLLALATILAVSACSHSHPVAHPTAVADNGHAAATPATPAAATPAAISPNVAVSGDLAARCHLKVDETQAAPKFGFDNFQLEAADRNVLQRVADCLTTGPLAGHAVKLTGRADPRGTEEYNLGLGNKRAETVAQYLERLGVKGQQLASSTRGAEDATGHDESTWRVDRRVDLELND